MSDYTAQQMADADHQGSTITIRGGGSFEYTHEPGRPRHEINDQEIISNFGVAGILAVALYRAINQINHNTPGKDIIDLADEVKAKRVLPTIIEVITQMAGEPGSTITFAQTQDTITINGQVFNLKGLRLTLKKFIKQYIESVWQVHYLHETIVDIARNIPEEYQKHLSDF